MATPFRKAVRGEKMVIPAETYNAMIDAAIAARSLKAKGGGSFDDKSVLVCNQTATDQDQWAIVGLANPIVTPSENESEFQRRVTFDGVIPIDPTHIGKFAVLQEPLPAGAIGRAIVAGVTIAKLRVGSGDEVLGYAEAIDGVTAALDNVSAGSTRVLWAATGSGDDLWAVVRLGDGNGTSGDPWISSVTVEAADGSPSYAGDTIRFDETDGFSLSQPGDGVIRLDMLSADLTQNGIVDTTTQLFSGYKCLTDGTAVGERYGTADGTAPLSIVSASSKAIYINCPTDGNFITFQQFGSTGFGGRNIDDCIVMGTSFAGSSGPLLNYWGVARHDNTTDGHGSLVSGFYLTDKGLFHVIGDTGFDEAETERFMRSGDTANAEIGGRPADVDGEHLPAVFLGMTGQKETVDMVDTFYTTAMLAQDTTNATTTAGLRFGCTGNYGQSGGIGFGASATGGIVTGLGEDSIALDGGIW